MYVHWPQRSPMPTQAIRQPIGFDIPIALSHAHLLGERATQGDDSAGELKQQAVASSGGFDTLSWCGSADVFADLGEQRARTDRLREIGVAACFLRPAFLTVHMTGMCRSAVLSLIRRVAS